MKITLIYPPCAARNSEAFPCPSLTMAALAGAAGRAGHEVRQADLDIAWHSGLKREFTAEETARLKDRAAAAAFVRAGGKGPAVFRRAAAALERLVPAAGLYGITLADLSADPLLLNLSALLALRLKKRGARVVIGHCSVPQDAYRQIMAEFPVFDFGVFARNGEAGLLRLAGYLSGGKERPVDTLERTRGRLVLHRESSPDAVPLSPAYDPAVLKAYAAGDARLLASYAPEKALAAMAARNLPNLVVPYSFETTCPGTCAFCANDSRTPSNARPAEQVYEDLAALKRLGATGIYFINSAFNNRYAYAERLCDLMIKGRLGLLWCDCANMREIDGTLLRKMRAAGAVKLTFGMETGSPRLLRYIKKATTVEKISRHLRLSHRLGIWNHIELIGGLPTETPADIRATVRFIADHARVIDTYSLNPFFLYANSAFYRESAAYGLRVLPRGAGADYLSPDEKVGNFSERFEEAGGKSWREKNLQIRASTAVVAAAIAKAGAGRRIDYEHIWLLMSLYRRFGHAGKARIRALAARLTAGFRPYSGEEVIAGDAFVKHEYRRVLSGGR